jgi:hypothetical protein
VEVLIFENRLPALEGGELWTHDEERTPKPDFSEAVSIGESFPAEAGLKSAADTLARDGGYKIVLHRRWRQAAEEKSATKPVRLRDAEGQLDGALRFYTSRFLLVDLDVMLKETGGAASELTYRLSEHRRVKTQETYYFDHPKLGVLLRVTAAGKD